MTATEKIVFLLLVAYGILVQIQVHFLQKNLTELDWQVAEDETRLWKMERRVWTLEEQLEGTIETIDILSDPDAVADIREGENDLR